MIDEVVKSITNKIDTFLIAKIIKVDSKGFVDVQPLSESKGVSLPPILHVPMGQVGNSASFNPYSNGSSFFIYGKRIINSR